MRKIVLVLAVLSMACISTLNAQKQKEKPLAEAVEKFRRAMVDADTTTLSGLVMEELSYGHSSGHIDDRKSFLESLVNGKSDFINMELTNETIVVTGKTAIVRHNLDGKTVDNGKSGEAHLFVLLVWHKQKDQWKLLARQAVKRPL